MKLRCAELLRCPLGGGALELDVWESQQVALPAAAAERAERLGIDPAALEVEVETGVLLSERRQVYPIFRGVPRMLTFHSGITDAFAAEWGAKLAERHPGFSLPDEPPRPGERDVLRTFSKEWVDYDWDDRSYWGQTPEGWFRCMRYVLGLEAHPIADRSVLEVGVGIGGVADYNARCEGAEVVGVDLGYAADRAYSRFARTNPFLHIAQASAFALPFAERAFDFVYSFGVLHHTYDTETAVASVARLPRDGGRLFVWVYSPHDESRNWSRRVLMAVESVVRPLLWRAPSSVQTAALLPTVPLYMAVQAWRKRRRRGGDTVPYTVRDALHAARDRLTHRYVHRHTDEELTGWLERADFAEFEVLSRQPKPDFLPEAFVACAGVSARRRRDKA